MDHKKVGDLIPVDGGGQPFIFESDGITPVVFDAELNDCVIKGDLTGVSGSFVGSLDAAAIDVLDNIHIAGGAVSTSHTFDSGWVGPVNLTPYGYDPTPQHYGYTTLVNYSFSVPNDAGGTMRVMFFMEYQDKDGYPSTVLDENLLATGSYPYYAVDTVAYQFRPNTPQNYETAWALHCHTFIVSGVTPGASHTITVKYPLAQQNANGDKAYVKLRASILVDYFHKL